MALTYRLPLDKFPLTDWLTANARYAANYNWQAASTALRAPLNPRDPNDTASYKLTLGNTVQNNREISSTGRIDLVKLYNKVRFLNIINNAPPPAPPERDEKGRIIRKSAKPPVEQAPGTAAGAAPADSTKKGPELRALKAVLRSLMTARALDFTYTLSQGTLLPGYLPKTRFLGLDTDSRFTDPGSVVAPGVPFILGQQYGGFDGLRQLLPAGRAPRLVRRQQPVSEHAAQLPEDRKPDPAHHPAALPRLQHPARRPAPARAEPAGVLPPGGEGRHPASLPRRPAGAHSARGHGLVQHLVHLGADPVRRPFGQRQHLQGVQPLRRKPPVGVRPADGGQPQHPGRPHRAALRLQLPGRADSGLPRRLPRQVVGRVRGQAQQSGEVLKIPLPNWNIQYNGLSQLPFFREYFRAFTLTHAYSSTYNVASYNTSTEYNAPPSGLEGISLVNRANQLLPFYIVNQVTIAERLAPLIGLNFQTTGQVTGRLEYRLDRNVGLNTTNAQVTELFTKEIVVGFGYVTNRLKLPFKVGGEQRVLRNQLTARLDMSIRDNAIIQRSIQNVVDPGDPSGLGPTYIGDPLGKVTNGTLQLLLRPTVDYTLNQRLNLQLYFTRTVTTPRVANSYRNSATEGGVQLRYSLSQ